MTAAATTAPVAPTLAPVAPTTAPVAPTPLESAVRAALFDVTDPEIPGLSIVDLGIVRGVSVGPGRIGVELLPTFVGCPAIELIRAAVIERLAAFAPIVEAEVTFAEPWTTARISPDGRRRLRERGFAPPMDLDLCAPAASAPEPREWLDLPVLYMPSVAECPYCGSSNTTLENAFGPTACRAIWHCTDCRQPFEQFKQV